MKSANPTDWYFLAFLVSSINFSSLISNYESYFEHFGIFGQCLNITGYLTLSYIEKSTSTGSYILATFC